MFSTIAAIASLVILALIQISLILFITGFAKTKRQIERIVVDFISAPNAQTPSPLATTVDQMAQVISRAVMVQLQTTIMGKASVQAKAEKAAISQAILAKYPWLTTLTGLVPSLSKNMLKNPALLNLAAQLGSSIKSSPAPSPSNGGRTNVPPPSFDL